MLSFAALLLIRRIDRLQYRYRTRKKMVRRVLESHRHSCLCGFCKVHSAGTGCATHSVRLFRLVHLSRGDQMRKLFAPLIFAAIFLSLLQCSAQAQSGKALTVYFIDVEGGQSTLLVSPSGQSLLIDAGWPGTRDADRIMAAVKQAGITQIDYLVLTHYHIDHAGGVPEPVSYTHLRAHET